MTSIKNTISQNILDGNLTSSERNFLLIFKNDYLDLKEIKITELAKKYNISTATINRSLSKIGLKSWAYTKSMILQEIENSDETKRIIEKKDDIPALLKETYISDRQIKDLSNLAKEIKKSKSIIINSYGITSSLGNLLTVSLNTKGINARFINGHDIGALKNIKDVDLIYISLNGLSEKSIYLEDMNLNKLAYITGNANYNKKIESQFKNSIFPKKVASDNNVSYDGHINFLRCYILLKELFSLI